MISTRRLGRARHEFRFGGRELVVLGAVFCLIASLVFAAGIVVGREMARAKAGPRAESAREHHPPDSGGLRVSEAPVKTAATRAEESLAILRSIGTTTMVREVEAVLTAARAGGAPGDTASEASEASTASAPGPPTSPITSGTSRD